MKNFIVICTLICAPVFAAADAHRSDCAVAVDMATEIGNAFGDAVVVSEPVAGGLCRIVFANDDIRFVADLQIEQTADDILTVDLDFDETLIGNHAFEGGGLFALDTTTRVLTIRRFSARADDGYGVALRGELVLGDASDIMARLMATRLRTLSVQHFITPAILKDLNFQNDMMPCAVISDTQALLGCAEVPRQSRREILRFSEGVPNATGRFDISLVSPDDMPVAAIVTPFLRISQEDIPEVLGRVLSDNLRLTARWNPGRM